MIQTALSTKSEKDLCLPKIMGFFSPYPKLIRRQLHRSVRETHGQTDRLFASEDGRMTGFIFP